MSKKYLSKFLINDKVSFKHEFEMQMFGFFYINDIIISKETLRYQLYKIVNNEKILVAGLYKSNDLLKVEPEVRSKHKLSKLKKKHKIKFKKIKKKSLQELHYVDAVIGFRLKDNKTRLIRTSEFRTKDEAFNAILQIYPKAEFMCYQMIGWRNKEIADFIELEYEKLYEGHYN